MGQRGMTWSWRLSARHRRRIAIPALLAWLVVAVLAVSPAAEAIGERAAGSGGKAGSASCAKGKRTKKKSKRGKRKRKKACRRPAAPIPPRPADSSPPPPPDACGERIPRGRAGHWECTLSEDFGGTGLDPDRWVPQRTDTSGYQNGPTACFVDDPDNVSVSDGTLKLTARREAEPFTCHSPLGDFDTEYTSGMVSTWDRFSQAFGRFEIRARISDAQVKGLQSALWLWPADADRYGSWPASGEIDIAEMFSQYPDRAIPYIHYEQAEGGGDVTNTNCFIADLEEFHTYAVEWTAGGIRVLYDGETCLVHLWDPESPLVSPQPFDQPFLVVLTQALGIGTNEFDPDTTPLPATTEVDYVRVWE
jgi:beta-glucanase (GH16 family)